MINRVNQKEIARGGTAKGVSKDEFAVFAPALIHYRDIEKYADKIMNLRALMRKTPSSQRQSCLNACKRQFAGEFLGDDANSAGIERLLNNLKDYGDNAIRYFRLTRYVYIRGGGFYVDLEPRRKVEIESLLAFDDARSNAYETNAEYLAYMSDISLPRLPWETREKYIEIIAGIASDIKQCEAQLRTSGAKIRKCENMSVRTLKAYAAELRSYRQSLQNRIAGQESQKAEQIQSCIHGLTNIARHDNRSVLLEKLSALGLHALNDALKIQPNYPVGDDNEPTFTAPGGVPDIECFYAAFNAICEVTMLRSRDQWFNEGQPVMRHLRDFEDKHPDKTAYCLFIAPSLHRDTLNTFWTAVRYEYEGRKQKIVPLSIADFVSILNVLLAIKAQEGFLSHSELFRLYDEILASSDDCENAHVWTKQIPAIIASWGKTLIS